MSEDALDLALAQRKRKKRPRDAEDDGPIIGIDGEGYDLPDGRHVYVYLAAVDETGLVVGEAFDPGGLSHDACVRMLLSLPKKGLKFGFMFSYDTTKIVEELPAIDRYYLMRPKLRDETICHDCREIYPPHTVSCASCAGQLRGYTRKVRWKKRSFDYFNGSLTISKGTKTIKIWDCFRFFGCAFVQALKDWNRDGDRDEHIATNAQIERIQEMKQKRGALENEDIDAVKRYCQEECHLLAKLMRKVKDAHEAAGIPLARYEGAGSTATALLRANEVAAYKGRPHRMISEQDPDLARAIESSFFGGRFEDDVVGIIRMPVFGFDLSSAYPYAQFFLPCLTCGTWWRETNATKAILASAPIALARFRVRAVDPEARSKMAWCPLPCRDEKGSIAYGVNFSGWAWGPEILAALEGWPDLVELTGEAYLYETRCDHRPFGYVPGVYRKRNEWGKDGPGLALKLGMNAGYGKTAQSIGEDPPFQSWIWAGMTTACARGEILRAIMTARDPWNVLTIATDGIYALEDLPIGAPARDTGTGDLKKPLGGWERKPIPEGIFVAKPGLYYRLEPELSDVRARGVGRREVFSSREKLEAAFREWDRQDMDYACPLSSRRFYGAKHSILARSRCTKHDVSWPGVPEQGCPAIDDKTGKRCAKVGDEFETGFVRDDEGKVAYGTWGLREVRVGFDPYPKRERHGLSREGDFARLRVRDLEGRTSAPYDVGLAQTTPEGEAARYGKELQLEQPDWDEELSHDIPDDWQDG